MSKLVEIRARGALVDRMRRLSVLPAETVFTADETVSEAVVTIQDDAGRILPWLSGDAAVEGYVRLGYNRRILRCPVRGGRRCMGERCQWYVVHEGTGDCAAVWGVYAAGGRRMV